MKIFKKQKKKKNLKSVGLKWTLIGADVTALD